MFQAEMEATFRNRLDRERRLRSALEAGQFRLVYQAIVEPRDTQGRWSRSSSPLGSPNERGHATRPVRPAGRDNRPDSPDPANGCSAKHADKSAPGVSNTPRSITSALASRTSRAARSLNMTLPPSLATSLVASGLPADQLVLEITESVLIRDADATVAILTALKTLGVRLGVDDFGTGYSSLSYLKKFPVDILKIDRSFVDGLGSGHQDSAIVKLHHFGPRIGAHNHRRRRRNGPPAEILTGLGCDKAQGFLVSRPETAATMLDTLRKRPSLQRPHAARNTWRRALRGTVTASPRPPI